MDSSDLYVGASVQAVYEVKKRTIILTLHGILAHLLTPLGKIIVFFLSVSDRILFSVICILYSVIMTGWQNRFLVQILSLILLFIRRKLCGVLLPLSL